jgi:hypothetical protein
LAQLEPSPEHKPYYRASNGLRGNLSENRSRPVIASTTGPRSPRTTRQWRRCGRKGGNNPFL